MRLLTGLVSIALISLANSAEVPRLLREREFNAADIATAANHFVRMGEEKACNELLKIAPSHEFGDAIRRQFNVVERVGWLCRILFTPKGKKPLRPPMYGGHSLPYLSMPLESWPLYPVAQSGDCYFVLSEGYILGGVPEDPRSYLRYCREDGHFRRDEIPVPSRDQAQKDVAALRTSKAWLAIKWTDSGPGTTYTMHEASEWKSIQKQADEIHNRQ